MRRVVERIRWLSLQWHRQSRIPPSVCPEPFGLRRISKNAIERKQKYITLRVSRRKVARDALQRLRETPGALGNKIPQETSVVRPHSSPLMKLAILPKKSPGGTTLTIKSPMGKGDCLEYRAYHKMAMQTPIKPP